MKELINFDEQFGQYIEKWMAENADKYENVDEMEAEVPELYLKWMHEGAAFLDGAEPAHYFDRYDDPEELLALMRRYLAENVPLPDPLLERLTDLGAAAERALVAALEQEQNPEAQMLEIGLLGELESEAPMALYVEWAATGEEGDDRAEAAAEALGRMSERVVALALPRLMEAKAPHIKARLIDVLCNFPGDDRIFEQLLELFCQRRDERALFASYLCKYGDERALSALKEALVDPDINYLDYIEICNAIEALGGQVEVQRDFTGDPYYESLRTMND